MLTQVNDTAGPKMIGYSYGQQLQKVNRRTNSSSRMPLNYGGVWRLPRRTY